MAGAWEGETRNRVGRTARGGGERAHAAARGAVEKELAMAAAMAAAPAAARAAVAKERAVAAEGASRIASSLGTWSPWAE